MTGYNCPVVYLHNIHNLATERERKENQAKTSLLSDKDQIVQQENKATSVDITCAVEFTAKFSLP